MHHLIEQISDHGVDAPGGYSLVQLLEQKVVALSDLQHITYVSASPVPLRIACCPSSLTSPKFEKMI